MRVLHDVLRTKTRSQNGTANSAGRGARRIWGRAHEKCRVLAEAVQLCLPRRPRHFVTAKHAEMQLLTTGPTPTIVVKPSSVKINQPKLMIAGCRCGLSSTKPNKLTCFCQRCPCYAASRGCSEEKCHCRGCNTL
jgi:hypothetical protein